MSTISPLSRAKNVWALTCSLSESFHRRIYAAGMSEPRVLRGRWSLPDQSPEFGVPGVLTLSDTEYTLDLEGTLFTDRTLRERATRRHNPLPVRRVLGLVRHERGRGREKVTLERCQWRGHEYSDLLETVWAESFWPSTVCIGAWFENDLPLTFDKAFVELSSLHAWTALSGFERAWSDVAPRRTVVRKYRRPPNRRARLDDGTVLSLAFPLHQSAEGLYERTVKLTQATRFELEFPEPRTLEQLQTYVYSLRNLLTLAVDRSVRVTRLDGYQEAQPDDDPPIGREVEILYAHTENPDAADAPHHHGMVFLLSDIDARFEHHMRRWFQLRQELGLVLDLYFSTLHVSRVFVQTRFMNYVQALEGYHRRRLPRYLLAEDEFTAQRDAIVSSAPKATRRLARKALAPYANEVSLAERISDVLVLLEDAASAILASGERSAGRFSTRLAEIRNIYAHVLDKPEPALGELRTLTYQAKALLEVLLLKETGFDTQAIDTMLRQSGKYQLIEIMRAYERGRVSG